jgi:hypothetical protein
MCIISAVNSEDRERVRLLSRRCCLWGFATFALVAGAVAAGCSAAAKQHYELGATEHCLFRQPAVLSYAESDADYVGEAAPGGGIGITLVANQVTLGFERNSSDAADDLLGVAVVGGHTGPKLHADSNVYVSWDRTPTKAESLAVEGCLRTGSVARIANKYPSSYVTSFLSSCQSAAENNGVSAESATSGCACVVRKLQARYTQDQSSTLSAQAVQSLEAACAGVTQGTSSRAHANQQPLRIPITSAEGQAILAALRAEPYVGAPPRLLQLAAAPSDPIWVLATADSGPNTQPFGALMHQVIGRWVVATSGSEFTCDEMPPPQVRAELRLTCQPN